MSDWQSKLSPGSLAPWTTLTAAIGLAVSDVVLSITTPGYDMAGETSSQLMSPDARFSDLARAFLAIYALLLVPFALQLPKRFGNRSIVAIFTTAALWLHIGAALVSSAALNDSDATVIGDLTANEIHDQAAIVMFGGAFLVLLGSVIGYSTRLALIRLVTRIALVMLLVIGPLFIAEVWTDINGVTERALGAAFLVWLSVTSLSWRLEAVPAST